MGLSIPFQVEKAIVMLAALFRKCERCFECQMGLMHSLQLDVILLVEYYDQQKFVWISGSRS